MSAAQRHEAWTAVGDGLVLKTLPLAFQHAHGVIAISHVVPMVIADAFVVLGSPKGPTLRSLAGTTHYGANHLPAAFSSILFSLPPGPN